MSSSLKRLPHPAKLIALSYMRLFIPTPCSVYIECCRTGNSQSSWDRAKWDRGSHLTQSSRVCCRNPPKFLVPAGWRWVFAKTPLCFGFLSGNYTSANKFSSGDHRSKWDPEQIKRWANAYKLFMCSPSVPNDQTNVQVALQFCLSFPQVTAVMPGMLTPEHVEENVKSSKLGKLPMKSLQMFCKIYQKHQFFIQN